MQQHWEEEITIPVSEIHVKGNLSVPKESRGIVLFAHGSGSSRFSPRNQFVAKVLQDSQIATLLMDLLTPEEEAVDLVTRHLRFDISLLAERVIETTNWLKNYASTKQLNIGYFGSSTGAAAALVAAGKKPKEIRAIVSRGGRPDLAGEYLPKVNAATLLIVGGDDLPVIDMNREAFDLLQCEKEFKIIPKATHLFEEPGALEEVARIASLWFCRFL